MTYNELLYRTAETTGIPRGDLGASDAALGKAFLSAHLRSVWQAAPWPDIRHVEVLPVTSLLILRTATTPNIGLVRKVTDLDPRGRVGWEKYDHWENETTIQIASEDDPDTAWVDYLEACPDLGSLDSTTLAAVDVPLRLAQPTILLAAGSLLMAKGQPDAGRVFLQLGNAELQREAALAAMSAEPQIA